MAWLEFLNLPQSLNLPGIGITIVFQLTGLLFIYSFIASLITPPHQECNDSSIAANHGRNGDADMVWTGNELWFSGLLLKVHEKMENWFSINYVKKCTEIVCLIS